MHAMHKSNVNYSERRQVGHQPTDVSADTAAVATGQLFHRLTISLWQQGIPGLGSIHYPLSCLSPPQSPTIQN